MGSTTSCSMIWKTTIYGYSLWIPRQVVLWFERQQSMYIRWGSLRLDISAVSGQKITKGGVMIFIQKTLNLVVHLDFSGLLQEKHTCVAKTLSKIRLSDVIQCLLSTRYIFCFRKTLQLRLDFSGLYEKKTDQKFQLQNSCKNFIKNKVICRSRLSAQSKIIQEFSNFRNKFEDCHINF